MTPGAGARPDPPDRVLEALAHSHLLTAGARILVAASGGPDSTALLVALVELGREVVAAHYDHDLRPGSAADAAWVRDLCLRLGVPLVEGRRRGPLGPGSRQAAARALRYRFLESARGQCGADLAAMAHTADDVVEGVLLHLLRGSGLAGLRGMPESRGIIVRPLMWTWRAEIEAYLAARRISARQDPSNLDLRYARARVRHQLLPHLEASMPGVRGRIRAIAGRAAAWQAELEAGALSLLTPGATEAAAAGLLEQPGPVRREAYRLLFARAGGPSPGLGRRHLEAIDALANGESPGSLDLPGGIRFVSVYGVVAMEAAPAGAEQEPPVELSQRPCPGCSDSAAAHFRPGLRLELGRRRPGLRIRPVGAPGSRRLQDILVDAKVPRQRRDWFPLIFADGELAWVPGLALSRDHAAQPGQPAIHATLVFPSPEGAPERLSHRPAVRVGPKGG